MSNKYYSLHIGLNSVDGNHYKDENGDPWEGKLGACENDANSYESFAKKSGFKVIKKLLTTSATSKNVLSEIIAAQSELAEGDTFFISYSGHGGSVPDYNRDEKDGKDETWCLYDRQLIDDELYNEFSKFRPGVRILIFSDSCHSGTVARVVPEKTNSVENAVRKVLTDKNIVERVAPTAVLSKTYDINKQLYKPILQKPTVNPDHIDAFVLLFGACQDNETAKEWGSHGIFTETVIDVLSKEHRSYSDLYKMIKTTIPNIQSPNLDHYGNPKYDFRKEKPFFVMAGAAEREKTQ